MTFDELVFNLAREMMLKSGVREWESPEIMAAIASAARSMALQLLGDESMTTNAVLLKVGTPITFGSEAGDTVAWSTEGRNSGTGWQSSFYDQDSGEFGTLRPLAWRYRIFTQAQATPTASTGMLDVRLKTSDGSHPDNDDGATDGAVSALTKFLNLDGLNSPVVDEAAANVEFVSRGTIQIPDRYFGVAFWNLMGSATTADEAETKAIFWPLYEDIQAAA